uniref:Uncharacterized protein n=1 Tax=Anguilla anguilla TaxID=7936 RepID=A0A0E9XUJ1_ANGAN
MSWISYVAFEKQHNNWVKLQSSFSSIISVFLSLFFRINNFPCSQALIFLMIKLTPM